MESSRGHSSGRAGRGMEGRSVSCGGGRVQRWAGCPSWNGREGNARARLGAARSGEQNRWGGGLGGVGTHSEPLLHPTCLVLTEPSVGADSPIDGVQGHQGSDRKEQGCRERRPLPEGLWAREGCVQEGEREDAPKQGPASASWDAWEAHVMQGVTQPGRSHRVTSGALFRTDALSWVFSCSAGRSAGACLQGASLRRDLGPHPLVTLAEREVLRLRTARPLRQAPAATHSPRPLPVVTATSWSPCI